MNNSISRYSLKWCPLPKISPYPHLRNLWMLPYLEKESLHIRDYHRLSRQAQIPMSSVLIRERHTEKKIHTEKGDVKMEAEIGVVWTQDKEAMECRKRQGRRTPPRSLQRKWALPTSDFWLLVSRAVREHISVVYSHSICVMCCRCHKKLVQLVIKMLVTSRWLIFLHHDMIITEQFFLHTFL